MKQRTETLKRSTCHMPGIHRFEPEVGSPAWCREFVKATTIAETLALAESRGGKTEPSEVIHPVVNEWVPPRARFQTARERQMHLGA